MQCVKKILGQILSIFQRKRVICAVCQVASRGSLGGFHENWAVGTFANVCWASDISKSHIFCGNTHWNPISLSLSAVASVLLGRSCQEIACRSAQSFFRELIVQFYKNNQAGVSDCQVTLFNTCSNYQDQQAGSIQPWELLLDEFTVGILVLLFYHRRHQNN